MDTAREEAVLAGKSTVSRFIILIPHRDARKPLYEYRRKLFAAGVFGAHSFPLAAPLASVSRPFTREELKELGRNLRNISPKFIATNLTNQLRQRFGDQKSELSFFGPVMNLPAKEEIFPQTAKGKILSIFFPPVLCAALVEDKLLKTPHGDHRDTKEVLEISTEKLPDLSFRAAALTNLAMRPLSSGAPPYSFEWKISPLVWLPAAKKEA